MKENVILCVAFLICLAALSCGRHTRQSNESDPEAPAATAVPSGPTVTCPVCGLKFPREKAAGSLEMKGKKYYFYLEDHLKAFEADPESYTTKSENPH